MREPETGFIQGWGYGCPLHCPLPRRPQVLCSDKILYIFYTDSEARYFSPWFLDCFPFSNYFITSTWGHAAELIVLYFFYLKQTELARLGIIYFNFEPQLVVLKTYSWISLHSGITYAEVQGTIYMVLGIKPEPATLLSKLLTCWISFPVPK